jgi:hypothetical protein
VLFVCCLTVVPLPPGRNPFAVKINNKIIKIRLTLLFQYSYPCNRPWGSMGLCDVEAPIFSNKVGLQMAVKLSALRAGRPLPPGRFLVLISISG